MHGLQAIIFTLTVPAGTPLYVTAIGSFIAIFFGKLVYGGFGHNIFNPALVGRVVVIWLLEHSLLPIFLILLMELIWLQKQHLLRCYREHLG